MSGNKKTLLVKRKFKKYIITEILRVLETFEQRKDFNIICGNSEEYGACIDKFTISRSGRSYLSSIRVRKPSKTNIQDDENKITSNREKRKRQVLIDSSISVNESSTKSPTYKKGNHHTSNDNSESSDKSLTTMTYSQAVNAKDNYPDEESHQEIKSNNSNTTKMTILNQKKPSAQDNNIIKPCASSIIPYFETSTAEMTTSTMTTEELGITTIQQ